MSEREREEGKFPARGRTGKENTYRRKRTETDREYTKRIENTPEEKNDIAYDFDA